MKRYLLSLSFIASLSLASAQSSFVIEDENHNDVTGGLIVVNGHNGVGNILETHASITNVSTSTIYTKVKRFEMNVVSGSESTFCWFLCYGYKMAGSNPEFPVIGDNEFTHSRTIDADSTDNALAMYHKPETNAGTSVYRYVVYDGNDSNDSAYVDVQFNVGFVGVEELKSIKPIHYPNPASSIVTIKLDKAYSNLSLTVMDMLGKKIETKNISGVRTELDVSTYKNGVYFYSIIGNNGVLVTRKFVVRK